MVKIRECTNHMRQKCVNLRKTGAAENAHIRCWGNNPEEAVMNLPGRRGRKRAFLPPHRARRKLREAQEMYPRITVGDLQKMVTFSGHRVSKAIIGRHLHANKRFGRCQKKVFSLTTNVCAWSWRDALGTLSRTRFCGSKRDKLRFWQENRGGGFVIQNRSSPKSWWETCIAKEGTIERTWGVSLRLRSPIVKDYRRRIVGIVRKHKALKAGAPIIIMYTVLFS